MVLNSHSKVLKITKGKTFLYVLYKIITYLPDRRSRFKIFPIKIILIDE
jgi:hypothetical protein